MGRDGRRAAGTERSAAERLIPTIHSSSGAGRQGSFLEYVEPSS